jgi:hypothetical protein
MASGAYAFGLEVAPQTGTLAAVFEQYPTAIYLALVAAQSRLAIGNA